MIGNWLMHNKFKIGVGRYSIVCVSYNSITDWRQDSRFLSTIMTDACCRLVTIILRFPYFLATLPLPAARNALPNLMTYYQSSTIKEEWPISSPSIMEWHNRQRAISTHQGNQIYPPQIRRSNGTRLAIWNRETYCFQSLSDGNVWYSS